MDSISAAITEYGRLLRRGALFRGMDDGETAEALRFFRGELKSYGRGEFLHGAGQGLDRFGMLLAGQIHVCQDDLDGNRMIMAEVTPGDTFGEAICYLKIEAPVYIYATEDSTVLWLRPDSVGEVFDEQGKRLTRRFISLMAERMLAMNGRIQILSKKSLRQKLVTFFTEYARRAGGNTFSVPFDRSDMAAFLGVDRSALSRELGRMKAEGVIDYYKSTFRLLEKE